MTNPLPRLIERFFGQRLARQRNVSPHTICSYRDTFKLFLKFAHRRTGKFPSDLRLEDFDAELVVAFLNDLDSERHASPATYNLRLTAIRCFFRFLAFEEPGYSGQIQRVLAIPGKIGSKREAQFLTRSEIEAILSAPDRRTWVGRRDYVLMLTAVQTGMRLSELVGLDRSAVTIGTGAHIRCFGKGRKERTTPITRMLNVTIKAWLDEPPVGNGYALFPTVHGGRMSPDAVQYLLAKYVLKASKHCSSLRSKRISPHVLRHSAAMELLDAGVDSTVISLWLGHESTRSTRPYLHAHLAIKEAHQGPPRRSGRPGTSYSRDLRDAWCAVPLSSRACALGTRGLGHKYQGNLSH